jgi:putative membrane protein
MRYTRTSALITLGVFAAASLGACNKGNNYGATDSAAGRVDSAAARTGSAATDSAHRMDSANAAAHSSWTDPSIYGFATAANNGEIQLGQLAEKKATNAKVKAFAREMVTDHRAMLADAKSIFSKTSTTADTTANDARDLMDHARDEIKELTDKAAGNDWDKNYMDKMVDDHQKVLDKLQDAAKNTTNADVRAALEKTTGKVQQHLTKAKDIRTNVLKD